jgi:hypothetical protein
MEPWRPKAGDSSEWTFEAEAEWPPLTQHGGYSVPTWLSPDSCVSSGVALALVRTGQDPACVTLEVPWPSKRIWDVHVRLVVDDAVSVQAWIDTNDRRHDWVLPASIEPRAWPGSAKSPDGRSCIDLPALSVNASDDSGRLTVCSHQNWLAVDVVRLIAPTLQYH